MSTTLLLLTLLMLVFLMGTIMAAEPGRVLNGHEFAPSELVPSPFAISYFSTRTGGGVAFDLKTPFVDLEGESVGTLEGDVAFMNLGFMYQQRFSSWFAASFGFGGLARIGVDEQSILAQGVTGAMVYRVGGLARFLQTDKVILSGGLDIANTDLVGMDLIGFAQRVIDEGLDAEDNSVVASGKALSAQASLRVGWAPKSWLGVTGYLEGGNGDTSGADTETLFGGGGSVGFDLKELGWFPLGFMMIGKTDAFAQGGADLASRTYSYGFSFSYTGWDDFSIGLEMSMNLLERRDADDDFEAFIGTFNLRYWP